MDLQVWPGEIVEQYHREGWWDDTTLSQVVAGHAARRPDAPAFARDRGDAVSWANYHRDADAVAEALIELGLLRGEPVAILLPDTPALHAAYLGAERAGHVVVSIPDRARYSDVRKVLAQGPCRAFVTFARQRDGSTSDKLIARLRREMGWRGHHVVLQPGPEGLEVEIDGRPSSHLGVPPADRALGADELFLVNFTAGATGESKGVMHTQNRWKYFHRKCPHFRADDVFLVAVPAVVGFGLWTSHFSPTLLGAPTVLPTDFSPGRVLEAIERWQVTVLVAVPTQIKMMLQHPRFASTDLSSLRLIQSGGEYLSSAEAMDFGQRTGVEVVQFYGSAEAGCVSGPATIEPDHVVLSTAGKPIPEMNVRLFDELGNDVTHTGTGRCAARGPSLTPGYWKDPIATQALIRPDGWLLLDDFVRIDDDGYLHVLSRALDYITRGGLNISAAEVEEYVLRHPRVAHCAAVSMPDPLTGERVCVYVVSTDGDEVRLEELTRFLEFEAVTKAIWPELVITVDSLPVGPGGKIAKDELRRDVRNRMAGDDTGHS